MGVALVENGCLSQGLAVSMSVVVVSACAVKRTLWVGFLDDSMVFAVHLDVRHSLPIDTVGIEVLIKLDHGELLLQGTIALGFHNKPLMRVTMALITALVSVLRTHFNHLPVVLAVLFGISLVPSRRIG